jgi:hypothetical protein
MTKTSPFQSVGFDHFCHLEFEFYFNMRNADIQIGLKKVNRESA